MLYFYSVAAILLQQKYIWNILYFYNIKEYIFVSSLSTNWMTLLSYFMKPGDK
jgi:hypothetical protein